MRADRLLAVLLLLQRRESVTAAEVAEELETSVRTARRDLEALAASGVPVYSTAGRGGGWRLVGGARTDLTGLTGPEVRALFLAAGSVPGQTPEVQRALAKLQRAVPETFREQAARAAEAVFIATPGVAPEEDAPALAPLRQAVSTGVRVEVDYEDRTGRPSTRVVDPLGLVQRGRAWYLVGDTAAGRRTFRVDRAQRVRLTAEPVRRPLGFDLREAWARVTEELGRERPRARLTALADPWVVRILQQLPWVELVAVGPADDTGRQRVELAGSTTESLCGIVAGLVEGLEVEDPAPARAVLARLGAALATRYPDPASSGDDR